MDVNQSPFTMIRGRWVMGMLLLANLLGVVLLFFMFGLHLDVQSPRVFGVLLVLPNLIFLLLIVRRIRRSHLRLGTLLGAIPDRLKFKRFMPLAILVVFVSWASTYIFYLPLSFVLPQFVRWQLFNRSTETFFDLNGEGHLLTNLLNFFGLVIAAPMVEEFVFRGMLLTRWSLKWGAPRAIVVSSLIFGLLHADIIGHFFFGYVMAVVYIETKSLLLPMCIHAANNAIAWIAIAAGSVWGPRTENTIAAFQSEWKWGMVLVAIVIPVAIWFVWRHFPSSNWKLPYFVVEEERPVSTTFQMENI